MTKLAAQTTALRKIAWAWPRFVVQLHPGLTERQTTRLLYQALRAAGFTRWAFPTIVAAGESAAEPHHKPTDRKVRANEFLKIDFGVTFQGWKTDITRTLILGRPTLVQRKLHALLLKAQSRAAHGIKAGIPARELDALARDVISRAGFGKAFIHSTGHGVGRAIHEAPFLSPGPKGDRLLRVGDVITIEPGIYIPNKLGLRVEDMYVVTKTGGRCLSDAISRTLRQTQ